MRSDVALISRVVFVFLFTGVDAEGFFFVDVGAAHGDGDGEDGNIHHDEVGDLDCRVEEGEVDDCEAGGAGGGGLEEAVEDADAAREGGDDGVMEL